MLSKINSFGILGIDAYPVEIEVDTAPGLPATMIVGLPDMGVKESKERIKAAIKNSGFRFPTDHITVNLAPADIKKEGALFDLPIALGILASSQQITKDVLKEYVFLGELSLEGKTRPIKGALPIAMKMRQTKIKKLILPLANAKEASLVSDIEVYGADSIRDIICFLAQTKPITPLKTSLHKEKENIRTYEVDFADVKGQLMAKRALEVAVAGGHNIMLVGPPGSGKSMLAKRIPTIMPEMTEEEIIETTCVHSAQGLVPSENGFITARPFRAPHHTLSSVALVGGGSIPQPGEINLAHNGVLFLDELPEFHRDALEALRQPLEDGSVHIARAHKSLSFPARFMLVAAMNPCPCGNYSDPRKRCRCSTTKIEKYLSKISGPLLDRIDIHIDVPSVTYKDITTQTATESSETIQKRVDDCRRIQEKRFAGMRIFFNSQMNHNQIKKFCALDAQATALLKTAMEELHLSARAYDKILKVARTIADLEKKDIIGHTSIAEAIQYRSLDRQLWA